MKASTQPPCVLAGAVLAMALSVAGCSGDGGREPRTNLVLISIDTLRPDHLGCYGYGRPTSPRLDALAGEGVRFGDVTSVSPWTLPSHATLLTGLYPSRHGVKDHVNRLPDDVQSLTTLLARAGYHTMGVVNSHNLSDRYGLDQGFQSFDYINEWDDPSSPERRIVNRGREINELGLSWVKARDERPFFLFLHYYDVHTDLTAEPQYEEMFTGPYDGPIDGTTQQLIDLRSTGATLEPADAKHLLDLYDAEIRQMDTRIGEVLDFLTAEGLAETTLVVVTSDHGEEFMEHGSVLHGNTYFQEVIAIPLMLRGPGVPSQLVIDEPVSLVDVFPTVVSLLGFDAGASLDGHDLSVFWRNPDEAPRARFLFAEADHNIRINDEKVTDVMRMVRVERHKLQYNRITEELGLYDLIADPLELRDLSEGEPERAETLLARIRALMRQEETGEMIEPPSEEELELLEGLGYVER